MSSPTRRALAVAALVLLALVFVAGLLIDSTREPGAILYAVPVILIALASGAGAGAAAGVAGALLFWFAALYHDERIDAVEVGYRMAILVLLGGFAGAAATRIEASERSGRRALELAEQNAERLEEAQRIAHLGSWEWDVPADSITWSAELYRIFDVVPGSFATTYESYLGLLHPDDRELADSAVRAAFETHAPFSFAHRVARADGTVRVVESTGRAFVEGGQVVRMAGTALDVTERVAAEEAASAARAELLLREERSRRGVELNDEIVQGLALAGYLLAAGDVDAATHALRSTLERARSLVGGLIGAGERDPGGLRRERAAEVE